MTMTTPRAADLLDHPVVVVVRHRDAAVAGEIARGCIDGGLRAIEVTLTTPDAFALMEDLANSGHDVLVGAGTVLTATDARRALDAGATYLVSPVLDPEVVAVGTEVGATVVPGAFTPSEIAQAARMGARMVKVFPASSVGRAFVAGVTTVLPDVPLMVSGGIADDDVTAWRDAGARCVAIGSGLARSHDDGGTAAVVALATRLAAAHPSATT